MFDIVVGVTVGLGGVLFGYLMGALDRKTPNVPSPPQRIARIFGMCPGLGVSNKGHEVYSVDGELKLWSAYQQSTRRDEFDGLPVAMWDVDWAIRKDKALGQRGICIQCGAVWEPKVGPASHAPDGALNTPEQEEEEAA